MTYLKWTVLWSSEGCIASGEKYHDEAGNYGLEA
jgi:hypothetical protein